MNRAVFLAAAILLLPLPSRGQGASLPRFGVGAKFGTLGIGFEGATVVTERSNLRFGFNVFDYHQDKTKDGIDYDADLKLRSVQVTYDQYLTRAFHVSPGILIYNGNRIDAATAVGAGESFVLGNTRYFSSQTSPIVGSAEMELRKVAPMVLIGFGNVLPRSNRRFGVNFDAGVVFQGSPKSTLSLTGSACTVSPTVGCLNAGTDPTVQSNVRAEQEQLDDDLRRFQFYPVLSIGVSWKF